MTQSIKIISMDPRDRNLLGPIERALDDTPAVLLQGARQTGKTTLSRSLAHQRGGEYFTFDDPTVLAAAIQDPLALAETTADLVVIDEIQKAPEVLPVLKLVIDRDRERRFLLTGSAHVLTGPRVAESLAGRMELLTLRPFSRGEIDGVRDDFVAWAFGDEPPGGGASTVDAGLIADTDTVDLVLRGGYPLAVSRDDPERRDRWFASYVAAILQRDVRDIAAIEGLAEMPRLLQLLAARTGSLLNQAEISRDAALPYTTLQRYLALLEATFLVDLLPAWASNIGKRLLKSPKVFLVDSALTAHLLGLLDDDAVRASRHWGGLFELFVLAELRKQASWSRRSGVVLHSLRTVRGLEVDLVLEDRKGRLVGIEIKGSRGLRRAAARGLKSLAEAVGDRWHRGIVLYDGDEVVPFGSNVWAIPLRGLWTLGAEEQRRS